MVEENSARGAYDRLAPFYDEFNPQNDYEHWVGEVLLPELESHGLKHGWVLDVGCGTGRAFDPLFRRGWKVVGCDVSEGMIQKAAEKYEGHLHDPEFRLEVADARALPDLDRSFDLVLALNDVVNYLAEDGDLERCFEGMRRNLAPGGLVCFDANCLSSFEANWVAGRRAPMSERGWRWTGLSEEVVAGGTFEVELSGEGVEPHRHRQRHWTREQVKGAMAAAGLRSVAVLGQREDGGAVLLEDPPDGQRHYKTIYIGGS
jgi:SAM-dependent methyltransferase